jgi:hypothetical protein
MQRAPCKSPYDLCYSRTPVDFLEACGVLGVEAGASQKEVRRAYLKLIRKHKPDRDPDGFQRTRDAYELLKGPTAHLRRLVEEPPSAPPERFEASERNGPDGDERVVEPPPSYGSVRVSEPPDEHPQWLRALDEQLDELDPAQGLQRILAMMRERPDEEGVIFRLLDHTSDHRIQSEEINRALRAAADTGHTMALEELARRAPRLIRDEELTTMRSASPPRSLAVRRVLMARRDYAAVVAESLAELQRVAHPETLLLTVHELYQEARVEEARALYCEVRQRLDELGIGSELGDWTKMQLVILDELAEMGNELPQVLIEGALAALRDQNPANHGRPINRWAIANRDRAGRLVDEMKARTPTLLNWFAVALEQRGPITRGHVLLVVLGGVAALSAIGELHSHETEPVIEPRRDIPGHEPSPHELAVAALCELHDSLCVEAEAVTAALRARDCGAAARHLQALDSALERFDTQLTGETFQWGAPRVSVIHDTFDRVCSSP